MITIKPVVTKGDLRDFVHVPFDIYKHDDNWVAPLRAEEYKKLDIKRYPFYKRAQAQFFIAREGRKPVGRIAAIVDHLFEDYHGEKVAYWGYFECENDRAMASSLFDAALKWASRQGCTRIIGPLSPSPNDVAGLLVDGFNQPPAIMMAYNPPYYIDLVEGYGHTKWKDLYAWLIDSQEIPERLENIIPRLEKRGGFTVRNLNLNEWDNEVTRGRIIYNDFERVNSIYTPMTDDEFRLMAKNLKKIIEPELVFFAEVDGRTVGMSITVPDFNIALKAARGRLLPFGIFKILRSKKKIKRVRIVTLGVMEGYRNRGIDLAFSYGIYINGIKKGFTSAELSWLDEDNNAINNFAQKIGARHYKTYRIYGHKI